MNNLQHAPAGSADAQQSYLADQVNLFLFDLKNEAREHGFKAGETWVLQIVTDREISDLKRQHHPVIIAKLRQQALLPAYLQVKCKLQQSLSNTDLALTADDVERDNKKHLAAYPERNVRN
jgi:hypothetical protein